MEQERKLALVGMSGGVDSSAAALLLQQQGYEVLGVTLRLYDHDVPSTDSRTCCSLEDAEDARTTCRRLGCRHVMLNRKDLFRQEVMEPFADTYRRGSTPNPCVDCNRTVKFPCLYRTMQELGGAAIATGHYARLERHGERTLLRKGVDAAKDQSYMLYPLSQTILSRTILPLGSFTKEEIRALAEENGLVNARKADSQDICFVPDGDYLSFLERFTGEPSQPGPFLNPEGKVIGTHRGYMGYTIGQRKGLGVPAAHRLYVYEKDPARNVVRLGEEGRIFARELEVERLNLIALDRMDAPMRLRGRVRYHHAEQPCTVEQTGEDSLCVRFDEPQRAVVPGQSLVLYDGEYVVGGGIISSVKSGE